MVVRRQKVVAVHRLMAVIDQPEAAALARRRAARVVAWAADLARRCHRRQPAGLVHQDQGACHPGALVLAVLVVAARDQSGGSRPPVPLSRPGRCPWAQQSGPAAGPSPSPPSPSPSPHPSPPSPLSPSHPGPRPARSRHSARWSGWATGSAAGSRSCWWWPWSPRRSPGGSSPGPSEQVHLLGHAWMSP